MDTKLDIFANSDRIVLHAYNGTQNLMVQGKNFENLALNYLKPYFTKKIETDKNTIELFNSNVQEKLSKKKPVLKQKSSGNKPFNCPQCKVTASTVGDLRMHLKSSHTKITNRRHNQMTLNEDLSLLDDEHDSTVTLDEQSDIIEKSKAIGCDWLPCDYKSKDKGLLIEHIDEHIGYKNTPLIEDAPSCNLCDFDTDSQMDLDENCRIINGQNNPSPASKNIKPGKPTTREDENLAQQTVIAQVEEVEPLKP